MLVEKRNRLGTMYFTDAENKIILKQCSKCSEVKPLSGFHKSKKGLGERQAECKPCHFHHHLKDREKTLVKKRKWYRENRESVLEVNRKWHLENHERLNEYKRLWLSGNRATKASLPNDWPAEERNLAEQYFGGCALTGDSDFEWDHVLPISLGYGGTVAGNMAPLRKDLNASKGNRNIFEWYSANRDRFNIPEEKFNKLADFLATANNMTRDEYETYVNECYEKSTLNGERGTN